MWEKIKQSVAFNIAMIVLAGLLGVGAYRTLAQAFAVQRQVGDEYKKIEELQKKKTELEAYIKELETKEAIEREGKARLNLKLPGEEVVVVVPQEKENKNEPAVPQTFWEWIKINFFK